MSTERLSEEGWRRRHKTGMLRRSDLRRLAVWKAKQAVRILREERKEERRRFFL